MGRRDFTPADRLMGTKIFLRLVTLQDCTPRYEAWLADPRVNRYLETRWRPQTLEAIRTFVQDMLDSPDNYLFAIVEHGTQTHVGNIKVGPINANHAYADVSYFIGETDRHGRGYATEAIRLAAGFAFDRLGLHRLQAGLYAGNIGSGKVLESVGFFLEGVFLGQLRNVEGGWEDHHWYGLLRETWEALRDGQPTSDSG